MSSKLEIGKQWVENKFVAIGRELKVDISDFKWGQTINGDQTTLDDSDRGWFRIRFKYRVLEGLSGKEHMAFDDDDLKNVVVLEEASFRLESRIRQRIKKVSMK